MMSIKVVRVMGPNKGPDGLRDRTRETDSVVRRHQYVVKEDVRERKEKVRIGTLD